MSDPDVSHAAVPRVDGMPRLGLGTWENRAQCAETVECALETGYRHVDTAQKYFNEGSVGEGLAAADVDREEVFLATKVATYDLGYGDVLRSVSESLERLGTDYVDLLYVHWPGGEYDPYDTLPAFAELRDRGRIDRIGVSNFEPEHCEVALDALDGDVFANQVELHPSLQQAELRAYADEVGIELVAYSPLGRGNVVDLPELQSIAAKHGVSEARVSLAWLREIGVTAIPKATGQEHLADNLASVILDLDEADLETIAAMDRYERLFYEDFGPDWE